MKQQTCSKHSTRGGCKVFVSSADAEIPNIRGKPKLICYSIYVNQRYVYVPVHMRRYTAESVHMPNFRVFQRMCYPKVVLSREQLWISACVLLIVTVSDVSVSSVLQMPKQPNFRVFQRMCSLCVFLVSWRVRVCVFV
jgi:hypothetical protein